MQKLTPMWAGLLGAGFVTTAIIAAPEPKDFADARDAFERRSSLVQRGATRTLQPLNNESLTAPVRRAIFPQDIRSIDGLGDNPRNPAFGSVGVEFIRQVDATYASLPGTPRSEADGLPSARAVSNAVVAQVASTPNAARASDYLWQWGQFLDHDVAETPVASPAEAFDIAVPMGDPFFDPMSTGSQTIALDRSFGREVNGLRQQINNITAYIDGSNVYGSEEERTHAMRTNDGTGRMKTSAGDLLPFNVDGLPNAMTTDPSHFLAGDIRANEQVALAAIHTLFVREHNYWADEARAENPDWTGDEVFEYARAIVAAQQQAITYNEFLPLLLGDDWLPAYRGFRPDVNPGMSNIFATAAYRVGHTMLSATILRLDETMVPIAEGNLALADAFFTPSTLIETGLDPVLRGLAGQMAQEIDCRIVDDVRNFLFGPPGAGGFDLASLNIQRGRDHGLGTYNDVREAFGLARAATFDDIPASEADRVALASVYTSVDDIDAWVGMLAENHVEGAMVGETLQRVLGDQFRRLRDGDRFWYETYLPREMADLVNEQTLARIIRRNTGIGGEIPDDVFRVPMALGVADFDGDGGVDSGDVLAYVNAYLAGDAGADLNGDRAFDVQDIIEFIRVHSVETR
ncbi:MAG: peroxidase family protein [Planctomycetota bacterium]